MNVILAIRTDEDPVEIYLLDSTGKEIDSLRWTAGYELSQTLLQNITEILKKNKYQLSDIGGLIVFKGPGGFTSLRLGVLTANTLAYSLKIPVVGVTDKNWLVDGVSMLAKAKPSKYVVPEYGRPPNITLPKK